MGHRQPHTSTSLGTLSDHTDRVESVAFSPGGDTLATGSLDGTAILWNVGDRRHPVHLDTLTSTAKFVFAVAFSPDGRTVATGGDDKTAVLWDLKDATALARSPIALACAIAGPSLSQAEWDRYVPQVPYERICP